MYAGTKKRPRKVAWPNIKRVLSLIKVFDELIDDHIGHMGFVSLEDKFSRLHTRLTTIQCNNLCASPTYVIFKGSYSLKWADGPGRTGANQFFAHLYKFIGSVGVLSSSSMFEKTSWKYIREIFGNFPSDPIYQLVINHPSDKNYQTHLSQNCYPLSRELYFITRDPKRWPDQR